MQGAWEAAAYKIWMPDIKNAGHLQTEIPSVSLVIEGEYLLFSQSGRRTAQKAFRLDGAKRPGWIDTDPVQADLRRSWDRWPWAGIYKLDGDTLTISEALGGKRPTDFSGEKVGEWLLILKRVKPRP
jgi:uncharacterized protein (TIGR03067 family)